MSALLHDNRRILDEKLQTINKLESKNQQFVKLFAIIGSELNNLNSSVAIILEQYNCNPTGNPENMLDILTKIFKNQNIVVEEDMKQITDSIAQNAKSLVDILCRLISEANSGTREEGDLAIENNTLRQKNTELLNSLSAFTEERNMILMEGQVANANAIKIMQELSEKNVYIDELNDKLKNLTIKVKSHPLMPYINYSEEKVAEHECICHICEKGMKREEHIIYTSAPSENQNLEIAYLNQSERECLLQKELEQIKNQYSVLIEYIEKLKFELQVTEERFISSKPFQYLVSQA
jgi:hypothetical protein